MWRNRGVLAILFLAALAGAGYFLLRGWAGPAFADVKEVPAGAQEIAWLAPATSSDAWERLVAAAKLVREQWRSAQPKGEPLEVNLDQAFLDLTADVPEIVFSFPKNKKARLLVRWYKLSGELDTRYWVGKLAARKTPPLAIIGGDISDRAIAQAGVLNEFRGKWQGADPLFLITTATAERYNDGSSHSGDIDHSSWPKVMEIYQDRTFRYAFTNTRMVESVLEFVRQNPQVCADKNSEPQVFAGALAQAGLAPGSALATLGILNAAGHVEAFFLYTLAWLDDGYSKDLAETFRTVFVAHAKEASDQPVMKIDNGYIRFSSGGYNEPNPQEEIAVGLYLATNDKFRDQHTLLVLPTAAQRARRFLRTLCRRAPSEVRNTVVLTGDAISFNNVYRDRDIAWNIQDVPVPLVFFSHRNPTDPSAGFGKQETGSRLPTTTGTQDLLLNVDILQSLLQACFTDDGRLLQSADAVLPRLANTRWREGRVAPTLTAAMESDLPLFGDDGNRHAGTGEHVLWLKPTFDGSRNLPEAEISIWSLDRESTGGRWRMSDQPLKVRYDRRASE
ncbi:MAG: hypothetical protein HY040_10780 [Planctomycetes bacterium]|nr:hypothetical protein [Planctomycetota bacterium]